ncbi:hypothetical protein IVB33_06670 [Bradyrhizobium sp. 24]|uniref:hypothetical protein n=1 Tax=unclassified Bradyrhizobium TaxID=2631580 RepID=UPI001FF8F3ED|nr:MULTISPECIES: hypothetical protein [unclassified Bradyrhizobium]MCK1297425.1 hypothetical protein [Bradyrhizobium sp. 37]MCK1377959.1 hypothetical protein [Bradyrhizobium sp. 24]MCK1774192.1 hypothetical protein [Bradyrhizobium sp. 134]
MSEDIENQESNSADISLEHFFRQNGLGFGGRDIFCIGGGSIISRVGKIILLLLSFYDEHKKSLLSQIIVIAPPGSGRRLEHLKAQLDAGIEKGELRPPEANHPDQRFRFVELSDLRSQSVIDALVPEKCAIIVFDAAEFRNQKVEAVSSGTSLPEDFWVPQVQSLCSDLLTIATSMSCYIVLDTGELVPRRSANIEILKSLDNVGLLAGEMPDSTESILGDNIARWDQLIAGGRIGVVIRDIEALDLSQEEKAFQRVQVFHRGGLHGQALEEIEKYPITATDSFVLAKLARIAADAGAILLAAKFLEPAINGLNNVEELALAVDTAAKISEPDLEAQAAARLETLFSEHAILVERAWRQLGRAGDYDGLGLWRRTKATREQAIFLPHFPHCCPNKEFLTMAAIEAGLSKRFEDQVQHINAILTRDARLRCLPIHALDIATRRPIVSAITARSVIDVVEELALDRDENGQLRVSSEELKSPIARVIEYLASNTTDTHTRTRLLSTSPVL